ncbi:MAG: hypothetical protein HFI33_08550 [Lachnospiraceae bacterium]|nr:hypothetical protein [Lachnospiraceae bacterium]
MKEEKRRKIEACTRKVREIVETYIDKEARGNTGQLKFLNGLLTGNLAVSIGITLKKDFRFWNYLENNFLKDRESMFSYFDNQKNLEEFARSPYVVGLENACVDFSSELEMPPYLLLRRAQEVMEQECISYLRTSRESEDEIEFLGEDEEEQVENRGTDRESEETHGEKKEVKKRKVRKGTRKKEAYVDWLFSIAIYEIFLIEYGKRLPGKKDTAASMEELETIEQLFPDLISGRNSEKVQEQIHGFCERAWEFYKELLREEFIVFCERCYILHIMNLCAMLRVITLIEFVKVSRNLNIDDRKRKVKAGDSTALTEATDWLLRESHLGGYYLFTDVKNSRNLDVYARKLRNLCQKFQISPHISGSESCKDYAKHSRLNDRDMYRYLDVIKRRRSKSPGELERELWEAAIPFCAPVIKALDEIGQLK